MSISAQRFKFLDRETNLPTLDFTKLNDNAIYSSVNDIVDSAIAEVKDSDSIINSVSGSLKDLQETLSNVSQEVLSSLKEALNAALDTIGNLELPDFVKDTFNSLKSLDLSGVKDFVKDLLHIGSAFLCNNLDFLKMFMLGYAINKNIIAGLLIGLLLSWLDRYCKGFTKEEQKGFSPLQSVEKLIGPKGMVMDNVNTFTNFTNTYASFIKLNTTSTPIIPLDRTNFLSNVANGDISNSLKNLRGAEISHTDRRNYLSDINSRLSTSTPGSIEYNNLLKARGGLSTLPLISEERRNKSIQYSNLSDKLGSMAKNIKGVDLGSVNTYNLSDIEKGLFDKVKEFKVASSNTPDILTRSNESGAFEDYNFSSVMPTITSEQSSYLTNIDYESTDHRTHDMHPTTEVFLEL